MAKAMKIDNSRDLFQSKLDRAVAEWGSQYCVAMKDEPNLAEQMQFLMEYVGYMVLNGNSEQNVNRIRYFLNMQMPESEDEKMKVFFTGGVPDDIFVYVDALQDIDLVDIHSMTSYDQIDVIQAGCKKWTKKSAAEFFEEVENDIFYDFGEEEISLDYSYKGNWLTVTVHEQFEA